MEYLAIGVGIWILCGIGAYWIAQRRGSTEAGTAGMMGLVLGPIGLLMASAKPQPRIEGRVCINCGKVVDPYREKLCNHCGLPFVI